MGSRVGVAVVLRVAIPGAADCRRMPRNTPGRTHSASSRIDETVPLPITLSDRSGSSCVNSSDWPEKPQCSKRITRVPGPTLMEKTTSLPMSLSHKSPSLIYAKTIMTISDFNTMHWCVIQLKISLFPRKRESTEGGLGRRLTSETGSNGAENKAVIILCKSL